MLFQPPKLCYFAMATQSSWCTISGCQYLFSLPLFKPATYFSAHVLQEALPGEKKLRNTLTFVDLPLSTTELKAPLPDMRWYKTVVWVNVLTFHGLSWDWNLTRSPTLAALSTMSLYPFSLETYFNKTCTQIFTWRSASQEPYLRCCLKGYVQPNVMT